MFRPPSSLTVDNAKSVRDAGLRAIAEGQTEVDLNGLTSVDSSAVATLLSWQRAAKAKGQQLVFLHFPANLRSLADLYGAASLLCQAGPLETRTDLPHH